MKLIFLLEENSMKAVLDIILPRILPPEICFLTIPHSGKSDLQQSIPRKLRAWTEPDVKFVIVQDQDSADCRILKQQLLELTKGTGRVVLIRIACKELEAWYFGDLHAVGLAYGRADIESLGEKRKYRIPDNIGNPKEELHKILPLHQQIDGARRIAPHMNLETNKSVSFQYFVSGVRKFAGIEAEDCHW